MLAWIYKNTINQFHKILVLLGLTPLARLIYLGYQGALTANPIEFITRSTGTWALIFLCLTLSITPIKKITGLHQLIKYRRTLGLFVFFYATLHFLIWFWLDHDFSIVAMIKDVFERPFITAGFISFVMLCPLALTSNKWSIRYLKQRWIKVHSLIYIISITVVIHYWWHKTGKHDYSTVIIYALLLASLLIYRLHSWLLNSIKDK